jgi:hypothetical protein
MASSCLEAEDANAFAALLRLILFFIAITPTNENGLIRRQVLIRK